MIRPRSDSRSLACSVKDRFSNGSAAIALRCRDASAGLHLFLPGVIPKKSITVIYGDKLHFGQPVRLERAVRTSPHPSSSALTRTSAWVVRLSAAANWSV